MEEHRTFKTGTRQKALISVCRLVKQLIDPITKVAFSPGLFLFFLVKIRKPFLLIQIALVPINKKSMRCRSVVAEGVSRILTCLSNTSSQSAAAD